MREQGMLKENDVVVINIIMVIVTTWIGMKSFTV